MTSALGTKLLVSELSALIDGARNRAVTVANATLTTLHWQLGHRVRQEVLSNERAAYGKRVVAEVAAELATTYGRSFSEKNLRRMMRFAEVFPDFEIVASLMRQLSWTHFILLMPLADPLARQFYAEMARVEKWSVRVLQLKLDGMLYERTALSKKPEELIRKELDALGAKDEMSTAFVLKDPYLLDFLELAETYSERDLESAILREIERFLLELGAGFTFVERQKRIILDGDDFYIDLLFYHRDLQRLVVIELKIGDFKPAYVGQLELYLRWLDKHERKAHEGSPLGIILCAGKKAETVRYLDLDARDIHVAEYLTKLPARSVLEARLHQAIITAQSRIFPAANEPKAASTAKKASSTKKTSRKATRHD
jgi:predicted nuclease of restriction endonuclease-like (RecB) superfamily